MNTRTPIQPSDTSAVLSLSFSASRNRFICGLSDGLRVFRTDNCLTTYHPVLPADGGIAIAEAIDDRYIAFVAGGRTSAGKPSVVIFWDCVLEKEVSRFDFYERILGLKANDKWLVVILIERAVVFEYQELQVRQETTAAVESDDEVQTETGEATDEALKGPNKVKSIHPTSSNPHAVACLQNDMLVLPAQSVGQIQLVLLKGGSKRVLRAHNGALRQVALSPNAGLLATASEQGTLVRVFDIKTLDQLGEFRRGVEKAIIYGLAFSEGDRWLGTTSDKGTIHIFDLRPEPTTDSTLNTKGAHQHRKSQSNPVHRLSAGTEKESLSGRSSPSTTTHHGSIQEYYGLRPPPASASPTGREAAATAIAAFKSSAFAPRIFKDVRSVASLPFYIGNDPPHWQGGVSYSWTTAPGGTRKRVRNPVPSLPADATGRPPKGVLAFETSEDGSSDDDGATFYVLAGGVDARWEMFDLLPAEGGGWGLVNRGFRRYLSRQFVD